MSLTLSPLVLILYFLRQVKLNVLKEEKRFLLQQLKSLRLKGDDVPFLLPPGLDSDLTDLSEDELEGRLASLKQHRRPSRRRSESRKRGVMKTINVVGKLGIGNFNVFC